jgi:di/tricarboxylate transporter
MHVTPLLYVAGFLALGAIIAESGLGRLMGDALIAWMRMDPARPGSNAPLVLAIGAAIGLLTTLPGLPAVMTPIADSLAQASGLPLPTVLMLEVPVFSTVLLPYQSPPMVIAMHMGGASLRDGARLTLALAAISVLVLAPLDYGWWRLMGVLP